MEQLRTNSSTLAPSWSWVATSTTRLTFPALASGNSSLKSKTTAGSAIKRWKVMCSGTDPCLRKAAKLWKSMQKKSLPFGISSIRFRLIRNWSHQDQFHTCQSTRKRKIKSCQLRRRQSQSRNKFQWSAANSPTGRPNQWSPCLTSCKARRALRTSLLTAPLSITSSSNTCGDLSITLRTLTSAQSTT